MTASAVLVLSWLVLAHLVADFVLQTGGIAADKAASGRRAARGIALHGLIVGICLVPFVPAYGLPAAVLVVSVAVLHAAIDRLKVVLTRRAEAVALGSSHRLHETPAPAASLGAAWTPVPAALFVLDQAAHIAVIAVGWAVLLRSAPVLAGFATAVSSLTAGDPSAFHRVVLTGVVLVALVIVNVRAGALLVATLVRPAATLAAAPAAEANRPGTTGTNPPTGWTIEVGPLRGRIDPVVAPPPVRLASPERVGEAIGILERLLIVGLVLANAVAAIGLVIAAKTVARFRQLDDRDFAEYYLLGTLCSVLIAVTSAFVAAAALGAA